MNDDQYILLLHVKDQNHLNFFYQSTKKIFKFFIVFVFFRHVNFNDVDRGGNSPLHIAVMNGRAINAEILLRTAKEKAESNDAEDQIVHQKFGLASINRLNKTRFYPLHLAVLNNHLVNKYFLNKINYNSFRNVLKFYLNLVLMLMY